MPPRKIHFTKKPTVNKDLLAMHFQPDLSLLLLPLCLLILQDEQFHRYQGGAGMLILNIGVPLRPGGGGGISGCLKGGNMDFM